MKKMTLIRLLMFASCMGSIWLYSDDAKKIEPKIEKLAADQTKKVLADLPKKIRISSKPVTQVKHITSSINDVLEKKIDPPTKVQEAPQAPVAKVESELEQTLLAMQTKASQKPSMKNALDSAIAELANSNSENETRSHLNSLKRPNRADHQIAQDTEQDEDELIEVPEIIASAAQSHRGIDTAEKDIKANVDVSTSVRGKTVVVSDYDLSPDNVESTIEDYADYDEAVDEVIAPRVIKNDIVDQTKLEKKRIYLGRAYNYAVIEEEEEKHFVVPTAIFFSYAFNGFDNCKRQVPLSSVLLNGQSFTVGDIFLESRLSAEVVNFPADTDNDASKLFLEPNGPGNVTTANGQTAQFGNRRRQQYLGLLAPVQVNLSTDFYQIVAQTGLIYRFYLTEEEQIAFSAGIIFPVVSKFQETCLSFEKGKLYDRTEFSAKDTTYRESSIGRFYNDFSDLEGFFQQAVLEPKGLSIVCKQQAVGIGDIDLFALADFAPCIPYMDGLQLGVNLSLPTSNKVTGNTLFEIELDGGGATTFDIFFNGIFNSGNKYFNPSFYLAGSFAVPFSANVRVPKLVSHVAVLDAANPDQGLANESNRVTNIPGLIAPVFREFFALSFSEFDSLVPAFADTVSVVRFSRGPKGIIGIGNYFYDVFSCNFRFGIFYDFTAQGGSTVCPTDCNAAPGTFDLSGFECIASFAHRVGLNLTYKFSCGELNVGAQFIVAGKNTAKVNEAFASFIAVF